MQQNQFTPQDLALVQDYLDKVNGRRGVDPVEVAIDLGTKDIDKVHKILQYLVSKKKAHLETVDQMPFFTTGKLPFQPTGRRKEDVGIISAPAGIVIK